MAKLIHRIPFQAALGALLLYGLTVSHGLTLNSLPLTAKIAGWDWLPMASQPLLWLLTLPLRLLPGAWVPLGVNFFSAGCGAVTIGLLARSMELLPWWRPLNALQGWRVKLPFLLAIVACGLEFSFWEAATAATGEMLDTLLLAAAIWCGLEYRAGKNLRWLQGSAFFWGLGLAENWVMQITLPLFILALGVLLKRRILRPKVVLPLAGLLLAGFLFYVLLPLANGLLPGSPWNAQQAWSHSWNESKTVLEVIYRGFWQSHRMVSLAVVIFFLLPLAPLRLRFGDEDTKNKSGLDGALIWFFRSALVVLLLLSAWLVFDPALGPRRLLAQQMQIALPLLTFDYVNALGIGFVAGNLLLVLVAPAASRRRRSWGRQIAEGLSRAVAPALTTLLLVLVAGLCARNLPVLTLFNRQPLTHFGELMLRDLPPGGGIVVSDFPQKLVVLQAALAQRGNQSDWLPVDIAALPLPEYRAHWERLHGGHLLAAGKGQTLNPDEMLSVMNGLAQSRRVFYLHPSFGYFFEWFYQEPAGLIFELKKFPADTFIPPRLTAESIAGNEAAWEQFAPEIAALSPAGKPASPLVQSLEKHLFLEPAVPGQIQLLREWYALALDAWGVQLQRNARLPAAHKRFTQALGLNPNNWVARINRDCNAQLQAGTTLSLAGFGSLAGQIGRLDYLKLIMSCWGPLDEPNTCYLLGFGYQQSRLPMQAMQQFQRAHELAPEVLAPQFALAELYARCRWNDLAQAAVQKLRAEINQLPNPTNELTQLAVLAARVAAAQTNFIPARAPGH